MANAKIRVEIEIPAILHVRSDTLPRTGPLIPLPAGYRKAAVTVRETRHGGGVGGGLTLIDIEAQRNVACPVADQPPHELVGAADDLILALQPLVRKLAHATESSTFLRAYFHNTTRGLLRIASCAIGSDTYPLQACGLPPGGRMIRAPAQLGSHEFDIILAEDVGEWEALLAGVTEAYGNMQNGHAVLILAQMLETTAYRAARRLDQAEKDFNPRLYLGTNNYLCAPAPFSAIDAASYEQVHLLWGARHEWAHFAEERVRPYDAAQGKTLKDAATTDLHHGHLLNFRAAAIQACKWLESR